MEQMFRTKVIHCAAVICWPVQIARQNHSGGSVSLMRYRDPPFLHMEPMLAVPEWIVDAPYRHICCSETAADPVDQISLLL